MKSFAGSSPSQFALLIGMMIPLSCRGAGSVEEPHSSGAPTLLEDLTPLKEWFAEGSDRPRAIALLSPT